jgi:hypothetical protein
VVEVEQEQARAGARRERREGQRRAEAAYAAYTDASIATRLGHRPYTRYARPLGYLSYTGTTPLWYRPYTGLVDIHAWLYLTYTSQAKVYLTAISSRGGG